MSKRVRESLLDTRTARSRLAGRRKPYYRRVEEGVHLGYRKPAGRAGRPATSGKWVLRQYDGEQKYKLEVIAIADDLSDADGVKVLTFDQAVNRARELMVTQARTAAGVDGPLATVADVVREYLAYLGHEGRNVRDAEYRIDAFLLPQLGDWEISKLTAEKLRSWLAALAQQPPRLRTSKGKAQQHAPLDHTDEDAIRRRRATANRIFTTLRAALNHAFREGKIASDIAWRRVKPFKAVDGARLRFLTIAESKRLINACSPEFRPMIEAALCTGARYAELGRLEVQDFDPDAGTLAIRKSKSGKPRTIYLTDEGAGLFKRLAAGHTGKDLLLRRANGQPWGHSNQHVHMKTACARAKIERISFHELRHTYASLLLKAGVPMRYVADALGHANTIMTEKHYAHLQPNHVADTIRKHAPIFGLAKSNVADLH
jgi:integrase